MTTPSADPLATGTHSVDIDGIVQRYHVHGTGPVCVAHSGGPGILWDYLRMPALERHLTVVYPEPIGTGAFGRLPSHPHGYTRPRYSRFLGALIEHLGVPEVHLLGHSHGGFVVQYHALHSPERVAGVVLYDSAPVTGPEHAAEAMRQVRSFAARHAGHPELPEVLAAFEAVPGISDDAQMTVVAVGVPALVVVGRHDVICGVRWAEELYRLIPGSELLILENSGHFGHIEEPEAFSQAVTRFVTTVNPPR
ncbi:alpha/beta fold hydrolase [Streptomyces sp. NPDC054841]